jgi:hypothetical protein
MGALRDAAIVCALVVLVGSPALPVVRVARAVAGPRKATVDTFRLDLSFTGPGTVTVDSAADIPFDVQCGRTCNEPLLGVGRDVKLAIKPAAGWRFVAWQGACSGSKRICALQLSGPTRVRVLLAPLPGNTNPRLGWNLEAKTLHDADLPHETLERTNSSVVKKTGDAPAGFIVGWDETYEGVVKEIESSVSLYDSAADASSSLQRSGASFESRKCTRGSIPTVGDEALAYQCSRDSGSPYFVIWRYNTLKGAIVLYGDIASRTLALKLAIRQLARMR